MRRLVLNNALHDPALLAQPGRHRNMLPIFARAALGLGMLGWPSATAERCGLGGIGCSLGIDSLSGLVHDPIQRGDICLVHVLGVLMADELLVRRIEALEARVDGLETETMAYSTIFNAMVHTFGPQFLELSANLAELTGANPELSSPARKRMVEALRIIDDIRRASQGKPKPTGVV